MAVILHSIYGNRVGLSADGVLVVDGVAATAGTNFGNGSAGSPTISFASDSDTGIYRKAANNIGFAVNGALALDISTTATTAVGNLVFSTIGKGVVLKQGSNGKCGTFVANGTSPVTVSNSSIAITDSIIISLNTVGGTVGVQPHVATITASTGFTVICTASDTSTYNYAIISNAA